MDIDKELPAISDLARSNGTTLKRLAETARSSSDSYLTFADCCNLALRNGPNWSVDQYHYLFTINAFVERRLKEKEPSLKRLWGKLLVNNSGFLDTVVEASWALDLWNKEYKIELDKPFDHKNPKSKDADIVVYSSSGERWLDAYSVDLQRGSPSQLLKTPPHLPWIPRFENLAEILARKATNKYEGKFEQAARDGLPKTASLGILLCIFKSTKILHFSDFDSTKEAPTGLFDTTKRPGLDTVHIHTLQPMDSKSKILLPITIAKWSRIPSTEL